MDTKITHTVKSYLESPMVKSSAFNIRTIKEDLTRRYEKLVSEKKIEMKNVAIDGKKYYVHYIIGTESDDRENNYDVIIILNFSPIFLVLYLHLLMYIMKKDYFLKNLKINIILKYLK